MKRVLIILLAVLSTVACKKVTPEMRIAQMADYMAAKENVHSAKLSQYEGDKRVDYLTLQLVKNLAADDLWSLENAGENSLVAEFLGKSKSDSQLTLLSASLDDPDACATILSILEAFRDLKISHKNDIQVLFYSSAQDSTGQSSLDAINQELDESGDFFAFDIELSALSSLPVHTFVVSDKRDFVSKMAEVIPPYLEPLGDYRIMQGTYPDPAWPLKGPVYRYALSKNELAKDAAAVAAFTFLLNF